MSGFKRLLKNSIANIINGFSNVILGIIISPFLLSTLTIEQFSVWSLSLQSGLFISILGFGGQIAVGRFISLAKAKNEEKEVIACLQNSFFIAIVSFILSILILTLFFISFDYFLPQIKGDANKYAFFIVSFTFCLGLLPNTFIGYFVGIERNDITATVNLLSRLLLGVIVIITSRYGLLFMSISYLVVNSISYLAIYLIFKIYEKRTIRPKINKNIKALLVFCFGLLIWNIAQFFISGIGGFIVGKYDFEQLAYYMLAMTLINACIGVIGAIINPIIQPIVKLNAQKRFNDVDTMILDLSMMISLSTIIITIMSHYLSFSILTLWVGHEKAIYINNIFNYLLVAFIIRLIISPYGMKLISNNEQLRISHYPLAEGLINLTLSFVLVKKYGAIGIAYSTIIAAIIVMIFYMIKYIKECSVKSWWSIILSFLIIPVLCCLNVFFLEYYKDVSLQFYIITFELMLSIVVVYIITKLMLNIRESINEV